MSTELETVHHERHFDRAGGTGSPVNLSEIKRGKLRVGHDNSPRPKGAGIFTTSYRSNENGYEFTPMRLPKIHNIVVDLGVERHRDSGFLESFDPLELVNALGDAVSVLGSSCRISNTRKRGEKVRPGSGLYPELRLSRGANLKHYYARVEWLLPKQLSTIT